MTATSKGDLDDRLTVAFE
ncbi:unnamed protein product, partial [Rotaria magnacalcarata]